MTINLKQLTLENFKGIRNLTVEFSDVTNILGENGTGKSTIFDAFTWLLWGKDSHSSTDFNIKTLDTTGTAIPKLEHSVAGLITVDGVEMTLKRTYQEKWQRRRGSEESELTGHETLFYVNDVPLQAQEYKAKIASLVDEGLFKLLTSATAFNSMKWQDRRQVLILIAGEISNVDVLSGMNKAQVVILTDILNSGKNLIEFKKELLMRKKKLSDDLKLIPSRIDEVQRGLPEPVDFEKVKKDIYSRQSSLLEIDNTITNQVDAYKVAGEAQQAIQQQIFALKKLQQQAEYDAREVVQKQQNDRQLKISSIKSKLDNVRIQYADAQRSLKLAAAAKLEVEARVTQLRAKWEEISEGTISFKPGEFVCPTCGMSLEAETITEKQEQMTASFEIDKAKRLNNIQAEGKQKSEQVAELTGEIATKDATMESMVNQGTELKAQLEQAESVQVEVAIPTPPHVSEIATLELKLLESPKLDIEGLKQQKAAVQSEIYTLQAELGHEDVIKRGKARIKELMAEEKSLAQQIADLEKSEFAMDSYTRARMDKVEQAVNEKFKLVRFRMFNTLINGAVEEACDCTVQGVPYNDVNSAGKIQAGIDVINTLSSHYGIQAPIFVDNRESTNELPDTQSQVINLIVSKDKSLKIN